MRLSATVLVALVVVLAGCAGGTGVPGTATDAGTDATDDPASTAGGNVNFYLSDRPNDIDDFASLEVTVTKVGLHRVGNGSGDGNGSDGEWITRDVDNATVDLTELQGANASQIAALDLPDGTYDKVFVYVDEVNGTLEGGDSVRVKLPSGKLHVNKGFTLGPNASVDFVFDISVHKAGNSGKYVLKPVVAESGTDVPIEDVGEGKSKGKSGDAPGKSGDAPGKSGDAPGDDRDEDEDEEDENEENLEAAFVGSVAPNASATVEVTRNGSPVEDANVTVNGERVGQTDAQGRITFQVPDGEELEVEVTAGEAEAELEREFEDEMDEDDGERNGDGKGQGNGNGRLVPIRG